MGEIKGEYLAWNSALGSAGSVCHCPLHTGTAGAAAQLQINPSTNCQYQFQPMQSFLRPDHATHLKEEPSPSSALSHPVGSAVLPRVLQSPGKFLLLEEFQRAEMHPGLGAEPPGRTTKDSWSNRGTGERFQTTSLYHALSSLNCTVQREPLAPYQTYFHSFCAGINNNGKSCTPFPVTLLYQLSLVFRQHDSSLFTVTLWTDPECSCSCDTAAWACSTHSCDRYSSHVLSCFWSLAIKHLLSTGK